MTTITVDGLHTERDTKPGFFARLLDRMAEAQMHRARAIAKPHLLSMSDEELQALGHTRDDIMHWPEGSRLL